jgi:exopolyphosphatase / guanosine-5'-triphosphate,3'-diphosphate pyrophosphatase
MVAAIIDCGTNTFNLLIAEFDIYGNHKILLNTKKSVKLGEGGLTHNKIAPQAFQRGIHTFNEFVDIAKEYRAETIKAFATSAVRSSINGPDFVKTILEQTGIIIQVINGDTEAQYIFKGVNLTIDKIDQPVLIMDIGGGSTEFILAQGEQVIWKKSFDLGAARLLQEFKPHDPMTAEEVQKVKDYFKEVLQPLASKLKKHPVKTLIGCSGSFESLSELIRVYKMEPITEKVLYKFDMDELKALHRRLLVSTESERKSMPGLVEYRADTIVFASILVRHVIKRFRIENLYYSSYSLKEGILADLITNRIAI